MNNELMYSKKQKITIKMPSYFYNISLQKILMISNLKNDLQQAFYNKLEYSSVLDTDIIPNRYSEAHHQRKAWN